MTTTYDFGAGPVPAHRHQNPNGSVGGWVADTAQVAPTAYVGPDALVFDNARVFDYAHIYDNARVFDYAHVYRDAQIYGSAKVFGNAFISGNAKVFGYSEVYRAAHVSGYAQVFDNACVCDYARVYDDAWIYGNAWIYSNAQVYGDACVFGSAKVCGYARVYDNAKVYDDAWVSGHAYIANKLDKKHISVQLDTNPCSEIPLDDIIKETTIAPPAKIQPLSASETIKLLIDTYGLEGFLEATVMALKQLKNPEYIIFQFYIFARRALREIVKQEIATKTPDRPVIDRIRELESWTKE